MQCRFQALAKCQWPIFRRRHPFALALPLTKNARLPRILGGHPKSGQWWSPQNRPIESSQDKGSYSASTGSPATIILGGILFFRVAMAD